MFNITDNITDGSKEVKKSNKINKEGTNLKIRYVLIGSIITLAFVFLVIALLLSFPQYVGNRAAFSNISLNEFPVRTISLTNKANNTKTDYNVYIAATPLLMQKGYMNATNLGNCDNKGNCLGMLFVFNTSQDICMWMKNTEIPLNQIWFNSNGIIVKEAEAKPYSTNEICAYGEFVLETNRSIPLNDVLGAP